MFSTAALTSLGEFLLGFVDADEGEVASEELDDAEVDLLLPEQSKDSVRRG